MKIGLFFLLDTLPLLLLLPQNEEGWGTETHGSGN